MFYTQASTQIVMHSAANKDCLQVMESIPWFKTFFVIFKGIRIGGARSYEAFFKLCVNKEKSLQYFSTLEVLSHLLHIVYSFKYIHMPLQFKYDDLTTPMITARDVLDMASLQINNLHFCRKFNDYGGSSHSE